MEKVRTIEVKRITSRSSPQIRIRHSIGMRVRRTVMGVLSTSGELEYHAPHEPLPANAYVTID